MTVPDLLSQIEYLNSQDGTSAAEFGPQKINERGVSIDELLAADRQTQHKATREIREFYSYGIGWKHCGVELYWLDPRALAEVYKLPAVAATIESDISGVFREQKDVDTSSLVLFAVDDLSSVFQRAYFCFQTNGKEPTIYDCGSEIHEFSDMEGYLEFWRDALVSSVIS